MGHERVDALPKTRRWRDIVGQIASLGTSDVQVSDIARSTMENVRSRLKYIQRDRGVKAAFQFFVTLAVASRSNGPRSELETLGIVLPDNATPLSFVKALRLWIAA